MVFRIRRRRRGILGGGRVGASTRGGGGGSVPFVERLHTTQRTRCQLRHRWKTTRELGAFAVTDEPADSDAALGARGDEPVPSSIAARG